MEALLTVDHLENLYQAEKIVKRRRILRDGITVTAQGFVDTTIGSVLTCDSAIEKTTAKARKDAERPAEKQDLASARITRKAERDQRKAAKNVEDERREQLAIYRNEVQRWASRARLYCVRKGELRRKVHPIAVRRAIARYRTAVRDVERRKRVDVDALLILRE